MRIDRPASKPLGHGFKTGVNAANKVAPQKAEQEVHVPATGVPEESRFKGYQTYVVQELEIITKDIIYHPGLPLHNNDSARDIGGVAKRRNISGSTKNEEDRARCNLLSR